jgi:hypothetical protein
MKTQSLSFQTRIARTPNDLKAACRVRAVAYGHHLPKLHAVMLEPDLLDTDAHTAVVLCVDKSTGAAVGTARFQTNAGGKLLIEHSVVVPEWMRTDTRSEISRLSTVPGSDPLVKLALMKASYLHCLAAQMRWMVICARSDSLVRQYRRLGFDNLFDSREGIPMLHVGRIDHQVLAFNVQTAEARWRSSSNALCDFMFDTFHPDIDLFSTAPALPSRRREEAQPTMGWEFRRRSLPVVEESVEVA